MIKSKKKYGFLFNQKVKRMNYSMGLFVYYFGSKKAKYFGLGNINQDQLEDYAKRRNISIEKAEKWIGPNLN